MKKIILLILSPILLIINSILVYAHCPLCTAAVGAAAVSAKYYGVDLSIIGLLIGAFAVSTGLWIGLKIKKKYIPFQLPLIVLASFLLTVIPLMSIGDEYIIINLFNKLFPIDKMIFGSVVGGITSLSGFGLHNYIKKLKGKVLFPYQGVTFTVALLGVVAVILFLTIGV